MDNLFLLLFFASIIALAVGLVRPATFSRFAKGEITRKKIGTIFGIVAVASFLLFGISTDYSKNNEELIPQQPVVVENSNQESTQNAVNAEDGIKSIPPETVQPTKTTSTQTNSQYTYYSVSSVVDGDTIKVSIDGTITTLRLIGMDTPETVDPRKEVQCFGKEASNKAKELLTGEKVRIEEDSSQGELDKYGRTLAYVYREDGLFYNKYMIEQGYAHEYTYNTPYKYQTEFKTAEKSAQTNLAGLWSPNTCNGDTTSSSTTTSTQTTSQLSSGKFYTSSASNAKYYAPESCNYWKTWAVSNLKPFNSLEELLKVYPSRTLSPQC